MVFCVLSRNRKTFAVSCSVLNLFASQIEEFFLPHSVYYEGTQEEVRCDFLVNLELYLTDLGQN